MQSTPPMTLFSEHPFELNLPAGATVEGAAAKAPGGMAVQSAAGAAGGCEPLHDDLSDPAGRDGVSHLVPRALLRGAFTFKPKPTMPTTESGDHDAEEHDLQSGRGARVYDCDGRCGRRGAGVCGAQCGAFAAAGVHGERDGRAAAGIGRDAGRTGGGRPGGTRV